MHPSRREFLQIIAAAGAASMAPWQRAYAYTTPGGPAGSFAGIAKFQTALRGVGPSGIPVALSDGFAYYRGGVRAAHYSLNVAEFADRLHPALGPTTLWGFSPSLALGEGAYPTRHLGGIIVARKGVPTQLTVTNRLPPDHILPVDISIPSIGGFPDALYRFGGSGHNAICTHLHGGFVPWVSDGGPMAWYTERQRGRKLHVPHVVSHIGSSSDRIGPARQRQNARQLAWLVSRSPCMYETAAVPQVDWIGGISSISRTGGEEPVATLSATGAE